MSEAIENVHLTDDDVEIVLQAIREGRVRSLDDVPYDPTTWNEESIRDWLEHTHRPTRARQIVSTLRRGDKIKSRPMAPAVDIAIRGLIARISQLERQVSELKRHD